MANTNISGSAGEVFSAAQSLATVPMGVPARGIDITFENGATTSSVVDLSVLGQRIVELALIAPSAFDGTVNVQVSLDGGTIWGKLAINGGSVIALAASITSFIGWLPGSCKLRLLASSSQTVQRTVKLRKLNHEVR
ncbi:MAG: hypothetical protein ACREA9_24675 [Pyrinomonadaceae bacterium]